VRADNEDELRAELEQRVQRDEVRVNPKARRMKPQDNVRAVVVKEVQLCDLVRTGALHRCSRASPSTSSPTLNCPLPRLRRPPRRPQRGHHRQGLRAERRAARRPTNAAGAGGVAAEPQPMTLAACKYIHKTLTQLHTYDNTSRTRCTPPTPDDASRDAVNPQDTDTATNIP